MKVQIDPSAEELLALRSPSGRWTVLSVDEKYDIIIISPESNPDVTCCALGAMLKPLKE